MRGVSKQLLEFLILQRLKSTYAGGAIVAVEVALAPGEDPNWHVASFDCRGSPIEDCERALSFVIPEMQSGFYLLTT